MRAIEEVKCCPICSSDSIKYAVQLPNYPVTEIYQAFNENLFPDRTSYDQELVFCDFCGHGYLRNLLPLEFIYSGENYRTCSSGSVGSRSALDNFHRFVSENIPVDVTSVIDIGANDTSLLKKFRRTGRQLIGIDPNIETSDETIRCVKDFCENINLNELIEEKNVFLCSHTLEHVYEPLAFFTQLKDQTRSDDIFFFQFPSQDLLIRDLRFDQVHHQHVHYFSWKSFSLLLEKCGFELTSFEFDADHYGTIMTCFRKRRLENETRGQRVIEYSGVNIRDRYEVFRETLAESNSRIVFERGDFYCYGASLMLPILHYYLPNLIGAKKIVDGDPKKTGLSYVNFDVEITNEDDVDFRNANFVVTAIATKLATRAIVRRLIDQRAMNIILPFNTL